MNQGETVAQKDEISKGGGVGLGKRHQGNIKQTIGKSKPANASGLLQGTQEKRDWKENQSEGNIHKWGSKN